MVNLYPYVGFMVVELNGVSKDAAGEAHDIVALRERDHIMYES